MASAHIEFDNPCDWGTIPLDDYNYSCDVSIDGLHEWSYERAICGACDGQETYCLECGAEGCH